MDLIIKGESSSKENSGVANLNFHVEAENERIAENRLDQNEVGKGYNTQENVVDYCSAILSGE